MIEADKNKLLNYLKGSNNTSEITEEVNNSGGVGIDTTTDSIDKITNLLNSINNLINSPLVRSMLYNKQGDKQRVIDVPEGYNPPDSVEKLPEPTSNKREKAELLYTALLRAVKDLQDKQPERTIRSIYEELNQEYVKEQIINNIEVIL